MPRLESTVAAAAVAVITALVLSSPAVAATGIVPGHLPYPTGGTTTIGTAMDGANSGSQLAESVSSSIVKSWRAQPPLYPEAANDDLQSVSVAGTTTIALDRQYQCSYVSAYRTSTGALLWRKQYHFADKVIAAGGSVYVLHDSTTFGGSESVDALAQSTGALRWSQDGVNQGYPALASGSGLVVNDDIALDATTGKLRFVLPTVDGDDQNGGVTISGGVIYYASPVTIEAFTTAGKRLWSTRQPQVFDADAHTDIAPQVIGGHVFSRSGAELNATTGKLVRTLPSGISPYAIDGNTAFFATGGDPFSTPATVQAVNVNTGSVLWKHTLGKDKWNPNLYPLPTGFSPVVEDGVVWLNTTTDTGSPTSVTALDEVTGALKTSIATSCNSGSDPGALAIAQHRVFSTSGCGLVTYTGG